MDRAVENYGGMSFHLFLCSLKEAFKADDTVSALKARRSVL